MRSTYVHRYDHKWNGKQCQIRPNDHLLIVPQNIQLNIVDVGRKHIYVATNEPIDRLPQPFQVQTKDGIVLLMRVIGNEMDTWYTLAVVDPNVNGNRFAATVRRQSEMDELIEIQGEDDVTVQGELDEWWTKANWKEQMLYHPEVTDFQVMLARQFAREAQYVQTKALRDYHIVAAETAIDS